MVKFARLNDAFSEFFLTGSPVEGQSLKQKDKRRKRKGAKIKKTVKPKNIALEILISVQA